MLLSAGPKLTLPTEPPEGMESSLLVFACADLIVPTVAKNITIVAKKVCFDFKKSEQGNLDLNIEGACGGLSLTREIRFIISSEDGIVGGGFIRRFPPTSFTFVFLFLRSILLSALMHL
jgi:hypothetical protein